MRKFYLEDAGGSRLPLNGEDGIFATDPAGLGTTANGEYADIRNGFFLGVNPDAEPQGSISLTLHLLKPQPYARYQGLMRWLSRAVAPLCLVYEPIESSANSDTAAQAAAIGGLMTFDIDADGWLILVGSIGASEFQTDQAGWLLLATPGAEYFRQVNVAYITKTELEATGHLKCNLSLSPLSPWYKPQPMTLEIATGGSDELRFDFSFTSALHFGIDSTAQAAAEIPAGGDVPASLVVTAPGPITDPVITLRGASSGRIYGRCAVSAEIPSGASLIWSTRYRDSFVRYVDQDGLQTDLLDAADISREIFPRVPLDESAILELDADSTLSGAPSVSVYYYFRSV